MSILVAFQKLETKLPEEVAVKARAIVSANPTATEVATEGFALWRVKDALNLEFVLERRAEHCPDDLRQALQQQHRLVADAVREDSHSSLWQGNWTANDKRASFVLDLRTGEVILS